MQTKKLGWTDLELSTIGLGSWALGGADWEYGWGYQDDRKSIYTVQRALELGINWLDTAPIYGLGHSEEVVGKAIRSLSHKPVISTKCGQIMDKSGNICSCLKKNSIRTEVDASLKRLKVEVIDLYQIHWPLPDNDIEIAWIAIADLIKEGKILYAGVSNFSIEQLKRIQSIHPVAFLQPPYSMIKRGIEEVILDYCHANKIGVIAYSPMHKGLLTGKYNIKLIQNLPNDDHRSNDKRFQEPELSANLKLVDGLTSIANKNGKTVGELAIAWVLRRPEVTAAIVGARCPSQVEENVIAGERALSKEDIIAIETLLVQRQKTFEHS
ncbi:MAG TPA: aldo/keto reductase [Victivallales bacterium]|nr:aldo/keto reductase [Victivallales bacterium]